LRDVGTVDKSVVVPVTRLPLGKPNQMLLLSALLAPSHYSNLVLV
jgi:hypothetical protein